MRKTSKRLSKREIVLGFASLVVICGGYFRFWFLHQQNTQSQWEQKIVSLGAELEQKKTIVIELQKRVVASVEESNKDLGLKEYVSSSRRLGQSISQIVEEDKTLSTNSIQMVKSETQKGYKDIFFDLELEGSFRSLGAFIERLEGSLVLSEVISLNIVRLGTDLERCVAKLSVKVRLFGDDDDQ